ncbi:uncharacterized protein LOC135843321 [Planococcus citri]|uniref:uncharacterized protein LOC135843321 n=1 Tax=Planococcus citri TaxID=170843 RepID=UPI0031FA3F55
MIMDYLLSCIFFNILTLQCSGKPTATVSGYDQVFLEVQEELKQVKDPYHWLMHQLIVARVMLMHQNNVAENDLAAKNRLIFELAKEIGSLNATNLKLQEKIDAWEIPVILRRIADEFFYKYEDEISDHQKEDDQKLETFERKSDERIRCQWELKCQHIFTDLKGKRYYDIDVILEDLNQELPEHSENHRVEYMCKSIVEMKLEVNRIVHERQVRKKNGKIIAFNKRTLDKCINIFYKHLKPIEKIVMKYESDEV